MTTKEFLINVTQTSGASGFEKTTATAIKKAFEPLCDEVTIDNLGNVIAKKKGKTERSIMFCAHMDEVGMMVTAVEEDGKIRLSAIGGIDPRAFLYQKATIQGANKLPGFICMTAPRGETLPSTSAPKVEDLYVDTGLSPKRVKELVRPGNIVTTDRTIRDLQGSRITGKALDDRAGVAALYACAQNLGRYDHDHTVYFVASVQEEVGCRGAGVATRAIHPDIGIAVDVGFAKNPDFPTVDVEMGKGPIIAVGPNCNYNLVKKLREVSVKYAIACQTMTLPVPKGTDASVMQIQNDGVFTGVITIPLMYMHTPAETITMSDLEKTGRLLSSLVIDLDGKEFVGY